MVSPLSANVGNGDSNEVVAMANNQYRARADEILAQSKVEQDPEVVAMLETVVACFRQLADTPALPVDFEFPREGLLANYPYKK